MIHDRHNKLSTFTVCVFGASILFALRFYNLEVVVAPKIIFSYFISAFIGWAISYFYCTRFRGLIGKYRVLSGLIPTVVLIIASVEVAAIAWFIDDLVIILSFLLVFQYKSMGADG